MKKCVKFNHSFTWDWYSAAMKEKLTAELEEKFRTAMKIEAYIRGGNNPRDIRPLAGRIEQARSLLADMHVDCYMIDRAPADESYPERFYIGVPYEFPMPKIGNTGDMVEMEERMPSRDGQMLLKFFIVRADAIREARRLDEFWARGGKDTDAQHVR